MQIHTSTLRSSTQDKDRTKYKIGGKISSEMRSESWSVVTFEGKCRLIPVITQWSLNKKLVWVIERTWVETSGKKKEHLGLGKRIGNSGHQSDAPYFWPNNVLCNGIIPVISCFCFSYIRVFAVLNYWFWFAVCLGVVFEFGCVLIYSGRMGMWYIVLDVWKYATYTLMIFIFKKENWMFS